MRLGSAFRSDITGYDPTLGRMRILPLLAIGAAMAAKKIAGNISKNKAEKKAAANASAVAESQRADAQKALNRRRTVLTNLAKALDREGFYGDFGSPAGGAVPAGTGSPGAADDDWTLAGVPEFKAGGSTLGAIGGGLLGGAMDAVGAYYDTPAPRDVFARSAYNDKGFLKEAPKTGYSDNAGDGFGFDATLPQFSRRADDDYDYGYKG